MDNFWIELKETQSGHQVLHATLDGKHWRGFLEKREIKREDGSTQTITSANMRPCNWEKCQICHPDTIFVYKK